MASGTYYVASGPDDGVRYYDGSISAVVASGILGNNYAPSWNIWARFTGVAIPAGAVITVARLTFRAFSSEESAVCKARIYGNAIADAIAPVDAAAYNALVRTENYTPWTLPSMTADEFYTTPDMSGTVQNIVDTPGWASGNAMLFLLEDDGSSDQAYRQLEFYESGESSRPMLYVEWQTPEIQTSLTIPVTLAPVLVNEPGDMAADLVIPVSVGVLLSGPISITPQLVFPISISGVLEASHIAGSVLVPVSIGGTMGDVHFPITSGLSFALSISGAVHVYDVVKANSMLSIPSLEMSASGIVDTIGNGFVVLPMLTMSATALCAYVGNATITLPRLTVSASAMRTLVGKATLKLPALRTSTSTRIGIVANGAITVPMLRISATAYRSTIATATITLPALKLDAVHIPSDYLSMVMNVRNAALTLYKNYGFNSMCHFDGKNLGATATGIHDLDLGDSDAGVAIEWNFKTGYIDLHLKTKKKLREAWLGCKATGDMIVTITDTDGTAYEYEAKSYEETERGLRVKFGRGYHRRYFSIDVKNSDGGSITLDAIRLILDKYGGRR